MGIVVRILLVWCCLSGIAASLFIMIAMNLTDMKAKK